MTSLLDRRGPYRGDQRRSELLDALNDLLRDESLEDITVADIATRAGVTRSAFYFYFESKAAAVAALAAPLHDQVSFLAAETLKPGGNPRERFETQTRGLVQARQEHQHLYRAMLDARHANPAVKQAWDAGRESFIAPLAELIDTERATGNAPPGPDSRALATVLLELNDRALEPLAGTDTIALDDRIDALTTIWTRAIYGMEPTGC
jgi:AcrR family transcriptional regulator